MPITSAPIGRNWHMSISHRRDKPFIIMIMAVIARYRQWPKRSKKEAIWEMIQQSTLDKNRWLRYRVKSRS